MRQFDEDTMVRLAAIDELASVRPSKYEFDEPSAEFCRWFEHGGEPRPEPLTAEQLVSFLNSPQGDFSVDRGAKSVPAPSAADWNAFKDWKLGALRGDVESLQRMIAAYGQDDALWQKAGRLADWCAQRAAPNGDAIKAVMGELNAKGFHDPQGLKEYFLRHCDDADKATLARRHPAFDGALKAFAWMETACKKLEFAPDKTKTVMAKVKLAIADRLGQGYQFAASRNWPLKAAKAPVKAELALER